MNKVQRLAIHYITAASFGILTIAPVAHAESAFSALSGEWTGAGTIQLSDGSSERLRCRASYRLGGASDGVRQSLRCASDAARFDIASDVINQGGHVSGTWTETNRNVTGSLQGHVSEGRISANVDAPGFSATLTVTTRGNRQSVTISSQGEIRTVSVNMIRS